MFHCYSGSPELAEICNERGWYMSFAGTVTFKNSKYSGKSLVMARPELILAETDAPFLTPHPFRGRPNASYMMNCTVRFVAAHRGEELEALPPIRENSERLRSVVGALAARRATLDRLRIALAPKMRLAMQRTPGRHLMR